MTWPMYLRREVEVYGRTFRITPQECEVLLALLLNRDSVIATDHLIEIIYPNPDTEPEFARNRISDVVASLRRIIGRDAIEMVHKGMRGITGYRLLKDG